jgi:hypothetical protein
MSENLVCILSKIFPALPFDAKIRYGKSCFSDFFLKKSPINDRQSVNIYERKKNNKEANCIKKNCIFAFPNKQWGI